MVVVASWSRAATGELSFIEENMDSNMLQNVAELDAVPLETWPNGMITTPDTPPT